MLMIAIITKLRSDFWQWKEAIESEGLECWPWMLTLRREGVLSELLYADDLVLKVNIQGQHSSPSLSKASFHCQKSLLSFVIVSIIRTKSSAYNNSLNTPSLLKVNIQGQHSSPSLSKASFHYQKSLLSFVIVSIIKTKSSAYNNSLNTPSLLKVNIQGQHSSPSLSKASFHCQKYSWAS